MIEKEYEIMNKLESFNWWYLSRRKLILSLLKKFVKKDSKILDIGCGTGANGLSFSNHYSYTGIHSSEKAVNFSKSKLKNIFLMNAENLNFKRNSFSAVLCLDVLEHIKHETLALENIKNVLGSSGILIITVPAFDILYSEHDKLLGHYRRYSINRIKELLSKNGFEIVYSRYWNQLLFLPVFFIRFLKKLLNIKTNKTDLKELPKILNNLLIFLLKCENILPILPFGTSIVIVAKKSK